MKRTNLTLAAADERRLGTAIHAILNPLSQPTGLWLRGALGALKQLLDADTAGATMPTAHGVVLCSPDKPVAWSQYAEMLDPMERRYKIAARARALGVYNRELLWPDLKAYHASAYHNEFILPNRMYDALGILVSVPGGKPAFPTSAQLIVHHERPRGRRFGNRGLALFRLLRPAFEAAVRNHTALSSQRHALASLVDSLDEGVMLCDEGGRLLHASTSLTRMLGLDPESGRVRQAMLTTAQTLARLLQPAPGKILAQFGGSLANEIVTRTARYAVRGALLDPALLGGGARMLVALVRHTPLLPNVADLCARFGLTARQADVALLIARGFSNEQIATELRISQHTARHHTEHLLTKFGVRSRAEVGPLLLR